MIMAAPSYASQTRPRTTGCCAECSNPNLFCGGASDGSPSCCTSAAQRTYLIFVNLIGLAIGIAVLILGYTMYAKLDEDPDPEVASYEKLAKALISTAIFICVTSLLGLLSTCCEFAYCLLLHMGLVVVIMIMELVMGSVLLSYKKKLEGKKERGEPCAECPEVLPILTELVTPCSAMLMTIILGQALMVYCDWKLFVAIRLRATEGHGGVAPSIVIQNINPTQPVQPTVIVQQPPPQPAMVAYTQRPQAQPAVMLPQPSYAATAPVGYFS